MFKVLDKKCTPTKGTSFSACVDLYAREDLILELGERQLLPLGVKIDRVKLMEIIAHDYMYDEYNQRIERKISPKDFENIWLKSHKLNLFIRSSVALKKGLEISNSVGVIDIDFDKEIQLIVSNPVKTKGLYYYIIKALNNFFAKVYSHNEQNNRGHVEIKKGEKIAQIELVKHETNKMNIDTDVKRNGGFGSTN